MGNLNYNQITLAWLNSVNGVSNKIIEKLLEYFNFDSKFLWDNFEEEKDNLSFLKTDIINKLSIRKIGFEDYLFQKLKDENASILTIFDDNYPVKLKQINGAPYIIYYKGSIKNINNLSIAIVGSRKATAYGKWTAEKFTKELAQFGVNIISGLAIGIDTIAHKTSLKYNTNTFGIIGSGLDIIYPKSNDKLYYEIADKGGAIITEYTFGMQPMPNNFHYRNRIISGLSDGVLVIEAQEKSGTLITASHAANQGREIFAVPGNIDSLYSKGTNLLIKDGAKITTTINDIIEEILEFKELIHKKNTFNDYNNLTENELLIINNLKSGAKSSYDLDNNLNLDIGTILSLLTLLEIKGVIIKTSADKFILNI